MLTATFSKKKEDESALA